MQVAGLLGRFFAGAKSNAFSDWAAATQREKALFIKLKRSAMKVRFILVLSLYLSLPLSLSLTHTYFSLSLSLSCSLSLHMKRDEGALLFS